MKHQFLSSLKAIALLAALLVSNISTTTSAETLIETIDNVEYWIVLEGSEASASVKRVFVYSAHNSASGHLQIRPTISSTYTYFDYGLQTQVTRTFTGTVTEINLNAFSRCEELESVVIPNTVTIIGSEAFQNCSSLTEIVIPNSVTTIGMSAFNGCSSLKKAVIGNNLTVVPSHLFFYCRSLEEVTIGSSVNEIENCAFVSCPSLKSITCLATTPPDIGSYVFDSDHYTNASLTVPPESIDLYRNAPYWKKFYEKPGDADRDSRVSIADVTVLIDYLLTLDGTGINQTNADVDNDDKISIADVTGLIDILLTSK